jgi:DNA polymerase
MSEKKLSELEPLLFTRAYLRENHPPCCPCPLRATRWVQDHVVLGHGNPRAHLILWGEGPGPAEARDGVPFNSDGGGPSGILLDTELRRLGIGRDQVFVDNVVACWPWEPGARGQRKARKPNRTEIMYCRRRVEDVIYRVDPLIMVALGRVALQALTSIDEAISKTRGELFMTQVPGVYKPVSYPVIPTYHPAYLLREEDANLRRRKHSLTNQFRSDLQWATTYIKRILALYRG